MFNIKESAEFPSITRSGRISNELQQIIDCLIESSKTNKSYVIEGVTAGNSYNSMQQRIRTQGKKLNLRVKISHDRNTNELYFKALPADSVSSDEVTAKPKAKKNTNS